MSDKYIENIGCPECGSSDALGVYQREDGDQEYYGNCFSCESFVKKPYGEGVVNREMDEFDNEEEVEKVSFENIDALPYTNILSRLISEEVCEQYGVKVVTDKKGRDLEHYYPHHSGRDVVCYSKKVVKDKKFSFIGRTNKLEFFGQDVVGNSGKMIIVTEGHLDALAAKEMLALQDKNYRVVSVPNGAKASIKAFKNHYEWINRFENIILAFDMDDPGREATELIGKLFEPDRVKVMQYSEKDAGDLLLAGKSKEFLNAIFDARASHPVGIKSVEDLYDEALKPIEKGISYPWKSLTDATYGYRRGELIGLAAGCVDGDTEYLTPTGWKKISEYDGGKVGQFEYDEGLSFVEPTEYIDKNSYHMYNIKTKYGLDMTLSDCHNVIYTTENGVRHKKTFKEIREIHESQTTGFRGRILTSFENTYGKGLSLSDDAIRLKVAIYADGSFHSKCLTSTRCYFNLKKERKITRLTGILSSLGQDYNLVVCEKSGYTRISFIADNRDKNYPETWWSLNTSQLKVVSYECVLWDGSENRFFTTCKDDADYIQYVFSSTGFRSSIYTLDRVGEVFGKNVRKSKEYTVRRTTNIFCSFRAGVSNKPEITEVDTERMYCFTVPSGKLILRKNDCIFVTGNSGGGKSNAFKELIEHTIFVNKCPVGVIFLEEPAAKTLKVIAGKHMNRNFHIPDDGWTIDELKNGLDQIKGKAYFFDHFGSKDWDAIKGKIRYMVNSLGVLDIFLDHLTALVAQEEDEYRALNRIMEELSSLCVELGCTIFFISHLRKSGGVPHEEGGHVSADQFKGSGAIVFWSHFLFGLERNQQADDPDERNTTTFRVLKDRNTGLSTGLTFKMFYDHKTGRWVEINETEFDDEEL